MLCHFLAGFSAVILPALLALAATLGGTPPESINTTAFLIVGWVFAVAALVLIGLRARQVNRWFVERYPALHGRLFWRPLRDN